MTEEKSQPSAGEGGIAQLLSRCCLNCRDSEAEKHVQEELRRDEPGAAGLYTYRTRLLLYSLGLFAMELLELGGALSVHSDGGGGTALTAQLSILLVVFSASAALFVLSWVWKNYWGRLLAQGLSFLVTSFGFLIMDCHFLGRPTDSSEIEPVINALVPIAFLSSLLPPVLMYNWLSVSLCLLLTVIAALSLRCSGFDWQIGAMEAGMGVIWLCAFSCLQYRNELTLRKQLLSGKKQSDSGFAPPMRGKTVTFACKPEVIGTDLEDILSKLDKLQAMLHDTDLPGRQWAEDTLSEVMNKLAMGRNIYQSVVQNGGQGVDVENLKFLEQNYLQTRVDPTIVKMGSVTDSRSGTQLELSLPYSISELLPVLHKIGKDWNFNIFFVSQCTDNHALQTCGEVITKKYKFQELLDAPEGKFRAFFDALASVRDRQNYKPNPYHNAEHAADVLASLLFLYSQSRLLRCMKDIELLASVVAALGHDVGHPAVTNRFLVTTRDPLAVICTLHPDNDVSVLEMMHSSVTFRVLTETGLLASLPQESWELVRKIVVEMILATDMSKHFDMVGVFRAASMNAGEMGTFEERMMLFKVGVKCADVGHAAKETSLHEKWTQKIIDEFFAQGDLEKDSNLPVSMYCDREATDISKSQIGFITAIVLPLFEVMNACLKSDRIAEDCVKQLGKNVEFWTTKEVKRSNSLAEQGQEAGNTGTTDLEEVRPLFQCQRSRTLSDRKKAV